MVEKETMKKDDNFLLYIPSIKHKNFEIKDGLVYLIFMHDKPSERFIRWLVKKPLKSDIKLDETGSFVWKSIDGKRNIYEIGKLMQDKFGEKCEPVYDRLIMYLRYLIRRSWVSVKKE